MNLPTTSAALISATPLSTSHLIPSSLAHWAKNTQSRFRLKLYTFTPKKQPPPEPQGLEVVEEVGHQSSEPEHEWQNAETPCKVIRTK